ncbi:ribonuclease H-like domain-containing protein [Tanacetum coccineum]
MDHGNPQQDLKNKGVIDSGCSRHMTGNRSYLIEYEKIDGGFVAFGCNSKGGKITRKVPRKDNMYSVDLKNVIPQGGLTCLFTKSTPNEYNLWHKRLGHGIKREFSVARTLQQNRVAERKNMTLIEASRTMLADSKLPITFWAEAVNTACYVQNRVLVIKPHNKTPYELFLGRKPALSFMRPFGCPVTILNTINHLDALTNSMNYKTVVAGSQSNGNAGKKACNNAGKARMETIPGKYYILLPMWPADPLFSQDLKSSPDVGFKPSGEEEKKDDEDPDNEDSEVPSTEEPNVYQEKDDYINNTNNINTASDRNSTNNVNVVSSTVNAVVTEVNDVDLKTSIELPNDPNMAELEDIIYSDNDDDVGAEAEMNNLDAFMPMSPIPTTRIHKDHPVEQIIGDLHSAPQKEE